jgi:hypothetical protein
VVVGAVVVVVVPVVVVVDVPEGPVSERSSA